jgi:exopolysaccharide biosynthesis polyprenyl glycosylphosphotransferase
MSSVSLFGGPAWPLEAEGSWGAASSRIARFLPLLTALCLLVVDMAVVLAAFLLAHWARFIAPEDEAAALGLEQYARMGLTVGLVTTILFALHGLYDAERHHSWAARLHLIVSSVSTALVVSVAVSFFVGDQRFSRLWFAAGWAFAVVSLTLWRVLAHRTYVAVRDAVTPANRVVIVGANALGAQVARELAAEYQVVGYVDNGSDLDTRSGPPHLGTIAQLQRIVQAYSVDQIVIALPAHRREQLNRLIAGGFHRRVAVKFVPELPGLGDFLPTRFEIQHMGGRPYIGFASMAKVSWLKRVVDLLLVGVGLVVAAPLLAAIAVAIKLDSPGPIFYRQRRVGKDGRPFQMIKFRSMRQDADRQLQALRAHNEATGPLFKMKNDPRITRVGRVLRRLSLDELPQLFNVLKGEMSLVGPRPPIPAEVEEYEDWQCGRLRAVPGITGLWQVSGRSEVPFHDMVRLDLHYIRNWSLALDLEILWRTIPAVLTSRGAY